MDKPVISSAANPTVRLLRGLASSAKQRREQARFIADGAHLAASYLDSGRVPELAVVAESAIDNAEISQLIDRLVALGVEVERLKPSLYESLCEIHAAVGISIVGVIPKTTVEPCRGDAVFIDGIQDPGNVGTILRTVAAADAGVVYASVNSASVWSPKALRAGMGAQFSLRIYESVDLAKLIESTTVPVYATQLSRDSRDLYELQLDQPTAWIFGNEGHGVSAELASRASHRVVIPQADNAVESLNASAAVAVCLYEQYRQRIGSK